jgi:hypothetical protein
MFSERSSEFREERARHAEDAMGVLTESQRRRGLERHTRIERQGGTNDVRDH